MKMCDYKKVLLLLLILLFQFSFSQEGGTKYEADIINFQKEVVAKLTGHKPIKGKKKLTSRASSSERKTTADFLFNSLKDIGLSPKRHSYDAQDSKGKQYSGVNVYAEIEATNGSDEYVILTAHYDTAKGSPGAVHNATGVALMYYVANKLMGLSERNRNFMIVFFDQQEANMAGCKIFSSKLKKDETKVHSMHRVDYIGWDNDEDRAIELLTSNIGLESLYRSEATRPVFKRLVATPESRVFSNLGFETITITAELKNGDNSPYAHQTADKYTTVNFLYLVYVSEVVFKVMRSLSY
ncbi:M28 family peptidase [Aquimarina sp. TRL1]|uniref:M28 family metallopeptidase n=1 Tax=Aquimarina sp. (strain TRL1) TaxID=2736252 RepID=UPI00158DF79A|nr:M28 family peptidase [Aquimarina sp. TRL1]QKX06558.1 M28 family peptidase [Aquimarina sp. TRL1]